jgi:hypothetical protein
VTHAISDSSSASSSSAVGAAWPSPRTAGQGLTLAHFRAQLEDLRDTSLTLELNLSTFGTHPRVGLGYMEGNVSLS